MRNQNRQSRQSNSPEDRLARRIARQQKKLEKEVAVPVTTNTAYTRMVKLEDVKVLQPITDTQSQFFDSWEDNEADAYILYGSAGVGKSYLAMYFALLEILEPTSRFKKIVIVRSSVPVRDVGFLPGTAEEKMAEYEAPYDSIVYELTGKKGAYEKLKDAGKIEFVSTSFLRGTTFNDAIVIFDEVQNENFDRGIKTVLTRIGKNTKLIVCGDGAQNDLQVSKNDVSGFRDFLAVARQMPEFRMFRFTPEDIVRSGFVKSFIMTCERLGV